MIDRGDVDENLRDCPWIQPDAVYCTVHEIELSLSENEEGHTIEYCKVCESLNFRPYHRKRA